MKAVGYLVEFGIVLFIMYTCWYYFYFSVGEGFVTGISLLYSVIFLRHWYRSTSLVSGFFHRSGMRLYGLLLPLIPVVIYLTTLRTVASWDVVDSSGYILMYLLLGIAWLFFSLKGMLLFWSFSYEEDALMVENKAAKIVLAAAFLGISLIYGGANIGDGPGWWTVVFAGGLGTVAWLLLGTAVIQATKITDAIIMDREVNSGIRFSGFLVASGLILARASSGDWTSFGATVVEFASGWPVLLLTGVVIIFERLLFSSTEDVPAEGRDRMLSILTALIYCLFAVLVVLWLPVIF